MCIKKLKSFLKGWFKRKPAAKPVITWLDRIRARFPSFRYISTARGGFNMPKFQSCPDCAAKSKRDRKTVSGAIYRCRHHGEFLVKRVGV